VLNSTYHTIYRFKGNKTLKNQHYFVHFLLVLPLLSRYEKTDPLPLSISDPVLDKPGAIDKFKKLVGEYEGENVSSFK